MKKTIVMPLILLMLTALALSACLPAEQTGEQTVSKTDILIERTSVTMSEGETFACNSSCC